MMQYVRGPGMWAALATVAFASACGGDPPTIPEESANAFSALIEGERWTADPLTMFAGASTAGRPGSLKFQGTSRIGVRGIMAVELARIPGPGSYPLGMNLNNATGGTITFVDGSRSWLTVPTGSAGVITIATLTESRVTGSFSFVAAPFAGTQGGPIIVSAGEFDAPLSAGFVPATPREVGGTMRANFAGFSGPWIAASSVASGSANQSVVLTANNAAYTFTITLDPSEVGTGPLSEAAPVRRLIVEQSFSPNSWGGTAADQGTITITSVSNGRIVGTFSGTLAPTNTGSGTAPLVLSNGTFDIPLP